MSAPADEATVHEATVEPAAPEAVQAPAPTPLVDTVVDLIADAAKRWLNDLLGDPKP